MPFRRFVPLLLLAACTRERPAAAPRTEFLVANADSTFWVTSDARGIRMRGAPLVLARDGGRFHELYVADDDRSFFDAIFVGQRLFRRDLISGDSTELLSDGEVGGMAERFASEHPNERPLGPDEEGAESPRTSAVAELRLLDLHGRFVSFEHLTDIDVRGVSSRHAAHGGVVDLRTGEEKSVRDLFGAVEEARIVPAAESAWRDARDSLLLAAGSRGTSARSAIQFFEFNAGSFSLSARDRVPEVQFTVPGSGGGAGGVTIPLPPQPVAAPEWWSDVRDELPLGDAALNRWPRERFELIARSDTGSGERATLALRDGEREWAVGVVKGPLRRVFWLDAPVISREARQALVRAFDEASLYSEQTRIVQAPRARMPLPTVPSVRHAALVRSEVR
ncbi:MAG: hypothetical protein HYV19_04390 [Gemmatimonadetes bacterium]|nr:hypothetical protein [Gemmatimonadota bacterium]